MVARRRTDRVIPRVVAVVLLVAMSTVATAAQEMRTITPSRQLEFWGGVANNSPEWGVLGDTPDMSLAMFGVRFTRPLGGAPAFVGDSRATFIHLDLVPIALMSRPYLSVWHREAVGCEKDAPCFADPRDGVRLFSPDAAMGFGVNPLGVTTYFRRNRRVSPSLGATGGFLYFSRPVPTSSSASFNFTAAVEVGLRFGRSEEAGVSVVYRLHHLSNAGTARENPAVASHLITVVARTPRRPIARR